MINRKDIKVTEKYDLVIKSKSGALLDVANTNNANQYQTLAQVINLAIQTKKREFGSDLEFGASPDVFRGQPMNRQLIFDIESYLNDNLNSLVSGIPVTIEATCVPVSKQELGVRIAIYSATSQDPIKMDFIYSNQSNRSYPINVNYG